MESSTSEKMGSVFVEGDVSGFNEKEMRKHFIKIHFSQFFPFYQF